MKNKKFLNLAPFCYLSHRNELVSLELSPLKIPVYRMVDARAIFNCRCSYFGIVAWGDQRWANITRMDEAYAVEIRDKTAVELMSASTSAELQQRLTAVEKRFGTPKPPLQSVSDWGVKHLLVEPPEDEVDSLMRWITLLLDAGQIHSVSDVVDYERGVPLMLEALEKSKLLQKMDEPNGRPYIRSLLLATLESQQNLLRRLISPSVNRAIRAGKPFQVQRLAGLKGPQLARAQARIKALIALLTNVDRTAQILIDERGFRNEAAVLERTCDLIARSLVSHHERVVESAAAVVERQRASAKGVTWAALQALSEALLAKAANLGQITEENHKAVEVCLQIQQMRSLAHNLLNSKEAHQAQERLTA